MAPLQESQAGLFSRKQAPGMGIHAEGGFSKTRHFPASRLR